MYTVIIAGYTGVKKFFRELLFLDGVFVEHERSTARFRWVKALTDNELTQLIHTIAHRHRPACSANLPECFCIPLCYGQMLTRQGIGWSGRHLLNAMVDPIIS